MWNVPNKIEIELQLYSVKMLLLLECTPQRLKNVFSAYEIEKSLRKESKRTTGGETNWLLRRDATGSGKEAWPSVSRGARPTWYNLKKQHLPSCVRET